MWGSEGGRNYYVPSFGREGFVEESSPQECILLTERQNMCVTTALLRVSSTDAREKKGRKKRLS